MFRFEGDVVYAVAALNIPPALEEFVRDRGRHSTIPGTSLDLVSKSKQVIHILDDQKSGVPTPSATLAGARSYLCVPMLKDNELVGAITIYRQEVRPFTDKHIELVTNFAAQAVIAIENTRLLNDLRQRTDDLSEALEQQTATSEVLSVISSSPGDLEPVFQAMLANATRLCEAKFGNLLLYDGETFRIAAMHGAPAGWAELRRQEPIIKIGPKNPLWDVIRTKQLQHIADIRTQEAYAQREPAFVALADLTFARTFLIVPMVKEGSLVGTIAIYRQEVRPFTDKQIELVSNFAAQAVIAIENTRLLNELRQRTDDLSEALEQQTATGEILASISGSVTDAKPVFYAIVRNLRRLSGRASPWCRF